MEILIIGTLIGLLPAAIAQSKGRSFVAWWIYGALLFIVALPHALIMKADEKSIEQKKVAGGERIRCPHCAELIRPEAKVCPHCRLEATSQ